MNGRIVKKMRKIVKKEQKIYHNFLCDLPLSERLRVCWYIIRRLKFL